MTAAVRALSEYAFAELGFHRIFAEPNTTNTASARVLEKAGFVIVRFQGGSSLICQKSKGNMLMLDGILSKCRLILKQINPEDLVDDGAAAMNYCFKGFSKTLSKDDEYVRKGQALAYKRYGHPVGLNESQMIADLSAARRFAGDRTLDRGRYFALCQNSSGDDRGTLVRELCAYHNPSESGLITIIDPTLPEHNRLVPRAYRGHVLYDLMLLFPPIDGRPHPFATRFTTEAKPLYVTLPMRIFETEIDRVIDLRRPDTANWFSGALSRLDWFDFLGDKDAPPFSAFPFKPQLNSFSALLPALLCQSIGGGRGAPQIAGLWLRKLGVNGLIFPSARCDCRVLVRDGEVVEWSGFNFVDYRNAQMPENFANVDFSIGWPEKIQTWPDDYTENATPIVYDTAKINYEDQGIGKGSWTVQGIEMRRAAPYCFAELAWLLDQLLGPDDPNAKNVLGLAYDFVQKMWRPDLSHDFVNALMGMTSQRDHILQFVTGSSFDQHPEIRESVKIVLQRAETLPRA